MYRPWIGWVLSAIAGALLVLVGQQGWFWHVGAQEPNRRPLFSQPFAPQAPAVGPMARTPAGVNPQLEFQPPGPPQIPVIPEMPSDDLTPEERIYCAVYDKVNRSVVNITTKAAKVEMLFLEVPTEGSGSGSVLNHSGHILTNYHVVDGAHSVRVTLFNNETFDATLVGFDAVNDIAVLKINAPQEFLYPVNFGDSSRLRVGQRVFALGNPFGLERTLTTGIISSLNRSLPSRTGRTMKSIIQIDAALNRGNSGGPLLDTHGRLIGMNTAIASATGENTGVGFSIPIDTIKRVVPQLIENGRVIRPDIGITRVYQSEAGLVIATMTPNGPAERAGLKGFRIVKEQKKRGPFTTEERKIDRSQADMILSFNNEPVKTADEFLNILEKHKPGQEVTIGILRNGQPMPVRVVLGSGE